MANYSSEDQLKANVKLIEKTYQGPLAGGLAGFLTGVLGEADHVVEVDLGNVVDFDLVDVSDPPTFINLLAQYQAASLAYARLGSVKREPGEFTDQKYWEDKYQNLLARVIAGEIPLVDTDGDSVAGTTNTFSGDDSPVAGGPSPFHGQGKLGSFAEGDQLRDDQIREGTRFRE